MLNACVVDHVHSVVKGVHHVQFCVDKNESTLSRD